MARTHSAGIVTQTPLWQINAAGYPQAELKISSYGDVQVEVTQLVEHEPDGTKEEVKISFELPPHVAKAMGSSLISASECCRKPRAPRKQKGEAPPSREAGLGLSAEGGEAEADGKD